MDGDSNPQSRSCLLIAMPQLQDPNFYQTTSLLSEFTSEGAMGVILNRPLSLPIARVIGERADIEVPPTVMAHWGGPVQTDRGLVVHDQDSLASQSLTIQKGLYLSGSMEVLRELLKIPQALGSPRFRLFLGYAGWGPHQLEQEIANGSWITAPLDQGLIFDGGAETLWRRSIANLGIDPNTLACAPSSQPN